MANHNPSVTIRMYRQGLGDCFLLTFRENGKPEFNMLVDCGLLQQTPNEKQIMRQVVTDVKETVEKSSGKAHLDAVVLTHEHADHISGFKHAQDVFKDIEFGEVWAAWMDDETHPKYKLVRERFGKQVEGLKAALTQMTSEQQQGMKESVEKLVNEFFEEEVLGAAEEDEMLGATAKKTGKKKRGRSPSWTFALSKSTKPARFFTPGTMFTLPGFDDIRIYMLGPSEDYETFTKMNPPEEDTYRAEGQGFAMMDSFFAAVEGDNAHATEAFQPFEKRLRIELANAENDEFFKKYYGFEKDAAEEWRRINDDWLSVAGALALNLDTYTNNTCLAFAVEFISSKKVLLFPGDAQFSNWLSWQKLAWEIPDSNGTKEKVTTKDLLARTVLYKVGHHGSHNATLKKHGLEMMTSSDLMAMIPVDRVQARNQTSAKNPKGWEMPEKKLYERLLEKTRGRVILADEKDDTDLKDRCKDQTFVGKVKFPGQFTRTPGSPSEPICIELTVDG